MHKLEVGYGSYGYEPNVSTFFGIPRAIQTGGAGMNIRIGRSVETHTGNQQLENQLRFQTGLISSALEHAVPEQMFSDPQNPTDGVSAVKALQLAAQQGQKIYQIDQNNLNQALNDINLHYTVEQEIRTAVSRGAIAIAHQQNIQVPGWSGAGHLILDPAIMDGSYKISGGSNGGLIAVDVVLSLASLAYDLLSALAQQLGSRVKILDKVTQILSIASFTSSLLVNGLKCPINELVFFSVLMAWLAMAIFELTLIIANPIAATVVSFGVGQLGSFIINNIEDCK